MLFISAEHYKGNHSSYSDQSTAERIQITSHVGVWLPILQRKSFKKSVISEKSEQDFKKNAQCVYARPSFPELMVDNIYKP